MAISNTKTRDVYTLDNVTTQFDITFDAVLDDNGNAKELSVWLIEDGEYTKLVNPTDYTVSALRVNYSDATSHAGAELLIARETPCTQLMDFVNNGAYNLQQIEDMSDKLTRIVQEHDTRLDDTETSKENASDSEDWAVGTRSDGLAPQHTADCSKAWADYVASTVGAHSTSLDYLDNYSANVTAVAGNATNINTVAGIDSDVTAVAGVSSDVATVAGISSDVSDVASNMSDINTVVSNLQGILDSINYANLSRQYSEGKFLDGTDVQSGDAGYQNNSKYWSDLAAHYVSGGLKYIGTWDTTSQTDYSSLGTPRSQGDVFYVQGTGCTIDGVEYTLGDIIIINQDVADGDTITTSMIDKIDNTETVTPDNTCTFENKTIPCADNDITTTAGKVIVSDNTGVIGASSIDTGDVVTKTGTQTLTNKTIAYADNTLTGVQPIVDYSTSEVDTKQKWIDGKKIYKNTIEGTVTTYTDSGSKRTFYCNISVSASTLIKYYGEVTLVGGTFNGRKFGVPAVILVNAMNTGVLSAYCEVSASVIAFGIDTLLSVGTTSVEYNITAEYTKTTD